MKKKNPEGLIQYFDEIHEILGWLGTAMILIAYALTSLSLLETNTLEYKALNLLGAVFLVYNTFKGKTYPPMILNIIWALIAIFSILN